METRLIGQNVIMFLNECWQWETRFRQISNVMLLKWLENLTKFISTFWPAVEWEERNGRKKKERLIEKCYYNFRTSINFARMKNGKMKKRMENWKF